MMLDFALFTSVKTGLKGGNMRRRAFTLVELLVVIAIIALLIAILLPTLKKAKESANRVKCCSNIRQIVMSMLMYSSDDKKHIYLYSDASRYYFRVTLWQDIPSGAGQFPFYVNMFFDTDNNAASGFSVFGSELLIQSGFSYQEKNGGFNEGSINGLNWTCLPAAPGTNFEFSISRAATFNSDSTAVFPTNVLNFVFQGMTPGFVPVNLAPASGVISFTNTAVVNVPSLPLGRISIQSLSGGKIAVAWDQPGTLQSRGSLTSGTWTNVAGAISPYVISALGTQSFFRLSN